MKKENHLLGSSYYAAHRLGLWLKYTSFGVTVVTILVGLGGIALGWIGENPL